MMQTDIFNNIPQENYFDLFRNNVPQYEPITDILGFDKSQMSKATGIAKDKMRFDDRMPKILSEKLTEIGIIIQLVANNFEGNIEKTSMWFRLPNPAFGGISPRDMIRFGRYRKLLNFVMASLDESNYNG